MKREPTLLDAFKAMNDARNPFGMSQSYSSVSYKGPFDKNARTFSTMGIDTPFGSIKTYRRGR